MPLGLQLGTISRVSSDGDSEVLCFKLGCVNYRRDERHNTIPSIREVGPPAEIPIVYVSAIHLKLEIVTLESSLRSSASSQVMVCHPAQCGDCQELAAAQTVVVMDRFFFANPTPRSTIWQPRLFVGSSLAAIAPGVFNAEYAKLLSQRQRLLGSLARILSAHGRSHTAGNEDKGYRKLDETWYCERLWSHMACKLKMPHHRRRSSHEIPGNSTTQDLYETVTKTITFQDFVPFRSCPILTEDEGHLIPLSPSEELKDNLYILDNSAKEDFSVAEGSLLVEASVHCHKEIPPYDETRRNSKVDSSTWISSEDESLLGRHHNGQMISQKQELMADTAVMQTLHNVENSSSVSNVMHLPSVIGPAALIQLPGSINPQSYTDDSLTKEDELISDHDLILSSSPLLRLENSFDSERKRDLGDSVEKPFEIQASHHSTKLCDKFEVQQDASEGIMMISSSPAGYTRQSSWKVWKKKQSLPSDVHKDFEMCNMSGDSEPSSPTRLAAKEEVFPASKLFESYNYSRQHTSQCSDQSYRTADVGSDYGDVEDTIFSNGNQGTQAMTIAHSEIWSSHESIKQKHRPSIFKRQRGDSSFWNVDIMFQQYNTDREIDIKSRSR